MKKLIALTMFTAFAAVGNFINGQNTFPSTGNAGIGTTNPNSYLAGTNGMSISSSYPGLSLASNGIYWLTWVDNTSKSFRIFEGTTTNTDRFTILPGGNVGIATTTPQYTLDVYGIARVTNNFLVNGVYYGQGIFASDGYPNGNGTTIFSFTRESGNELRVKNLSDITFYNGSSTQTEKMRIKANGNVGIGTATPNNKLTVNGNITWGGNNLINNALDGYGGVELGATNTAINPTTNGTPFVDFHFGNGLAQDFNARILNSANNQLDFQTNTGGTVLTIKDSWIGIGTSVQTNGIKLTVNGISFFQSDAYFLNKIAIGGIGLGAIPSDYKLAVNGKILATGLKIKPYLNWPDYVFNKDYELICLNDLELFINKNGHLPNIPDEQSIIANGLDVAKISQLQMEKIEELTLYIIELNKRILILETEINKIKVK